MFLQIEAPFLSKSRNSREIKDFAKMDINWLKICRESLRAGARKIMEIHDSEEKTVEISLGQGGDMTLMADKASEDTIIERLRKGPVDIRLVSEERGEIIIGKMPQYTIFLDPLDGSFNFKHGLYYFGISMAVMDRSARPVAAYVKDVSQGTEYYASGEGAYRNGKKINTSKSINTDRVLLECTKAVSPEDLTLISRTLLRMRHFRAPGAAALDLCKVADGTFDCLLFAGTSRYLDVAAGIYILERAGGIVSDFKGNRSICEGMVLRTKNLIAAGNQNLHELILAPTSRGS
jgi:myo-inositol-1(or 4)-monophosphatase